MRVEAGAKWRRDAASLEINKLYFKNLFFIVAHPLLFSLRVVFLLSQNRVTTSCTAVFFTKSALRCDAPPPKLFSLRVKHQPSSMEIIALCTIVATLRIFPNRSQFFKYESVTLSCGELKNSNWTIKRNTSTKTNEECSKHWGTKNESNCFLQDAYPSDSGLYWCDSGAGACSEAVNITVTRGSVILESPVHPLQEGDAATLRCMVKQTSFINLPAEFYKDGLLIRNSSTGNITILKVSKSDEGFYKCTISGSGESLDSWLSVKAGRPKSFHSPPMYVLLPVVGVCLFVTVVLVVLVLLFCLWRNHKE
ncbi:high affinity immunoglobulin gamma Fc receptor IB-like isoform X2 [Pundamilia nyererei]|uniref:high affinity immunoglobulin gamma Fc receptor IB-like isoform X2 n=1 Tax=Pundamilia nyererei TaxID=303518 RepID=UPI0003AF551F|nr:PREDICTED: high affinity immunoglobulin gamma Fc receptor IB-like isoform X2 [Pundamilia nyererei]